LDIESSTSPSETSNKPANGKTAPKQPWPADALEQTQTVRQVIGALRDGGLAVTWQTVEKRFEGATPARVKEVLKALETLGLL
jgi:hypothetical protein